MSQRGAGAEAMAPGHRTRRASPHAVGTRSKQVSGTMGGGEDDNGAKGNAHRWFATPSNEPRTWPISPVSVLRVSAKAMPAAAK